MIDIQKAYIAFNKYVSNYDINNPKIELKIKHTYRVVDNAKAISESLKLSKEEINLACLIALLHDIGRFEQLRIYNSFYDYKTVDHGDFAVKLLFEDGLIREFIDSKKYDLIIYKAIKYHNKFNVGNDLNDIELRHALIIRDSDKLDILMLNCSSVFEDIYDKSKEDIEKELISDKVYRCFIEHKTVLGSDRVSDLDVWVSHLALIFDFNYQYCYKEILDRKYVDILYNRLDYQNNDTKDKMIIIYQELISYLKRESCL